MEPSEVYNLDGGDHCDASRASPPSSSSQMQYTSNYSHVPLLSFLATIRRAALVSEAAEESSLYNGFATVTSVRNEDDSSESIVSEMIVAPDEAAGMYLQETLLHGVRAEMTPRSGVGTGAGAWSSCASIPFVSKLLCYIVTQECHCLSEQLNTVIPDVSQISSKRELQNVSDLSMNQMDDFEEKLECIITSTVDLTVFTEAMRRAAGWRVEQRTMRRRRRRKIFSVSVFLILMCFMARELLQWHQRFVATFACDSSFTPLGSGVECKDPEKQHVTVPLVSCDRMSQVVVKGQQSLLNKLFTNETGSLNENERILCNETYGARSALDTAWNWLQSTMWLPLGSPPPRRLNDDFSIVPSNTNNNVLNEETEIDRNISHCSYSPPNDAGDGARNSSISLRGFEGYDGACEMSEASLWEAFAKHSTGTNGGREARKHLELYGQMKLKALYHRGQLVHSPFAMHSVALRNDDSIWEPSDVLTRLSFLDIFFATGSFPRDNFSLNNGSIPSIGKKTMLFHNTETSTAKVLGRNAMMRPEEYGESVVNRLLRNVLLDLARSGSSNASATWKRKGVFRVLDVGCGVGGTMLSLAGLMNLSSERSSRREEESTSPGAISSFQYHCISLSGAEVVHGRMEAMKQSIDLRKVQFQQMSFDDPSLKKSSYSAIIAIESLSHSQNLTNTLLNLSNSLLPGGILFIVDDMLASHYTESRSSFSTPKRFQTATGGEASLPMSTSSFAQTSKRLSLFTPHSWITKLQSAGFSVRNITDLDLAYDLPLLRHQGHNLEKQTVFQTWKLSLFAPRKLAVSVNIDIGSIKILGTFLFLARTLGWLVSGMDQLSAPSERRQIQGRDVMGGGNLRRKIRKLQVVLENAIIAKRGVIHRRNAYERGELTLVMLVCEKM